MKLCIESNCHSLAPSLVHSVRTTRCMSSSATEMLESDIIGVLYSCVVSSVIARTLQCSSRQIFQEGSGVGTCDHYFSIIHPNSSSAFLRSKHYIHVSLRLGLVKTLYLSDVSTSKTHASSPLNRYITGQ